MFNMKSKIDAKDLKIIGMLKGRGDLTVRQIASKTAMPVTTVHHRIKRIKKEGIIKKFTVELDYKKIGKLLSAYVLLRVDSTYLKKTGKNQHDLVKNLKSLNFVEKADIVTGTIDMILLIRVRDIDELDKIIIEKLRQIEGIESTQTLVILNENP